MGFRIQMKIFYIIQGYFNHILYTMGLKDKPSWKKKLIICRRCPTNIKGICSKDICITINGDLVCGCGCNILQKVKSGSPCPKKYWK